MDGIEACFSKGDTEGARRLVDQARAQGDDSADVQVAHARLLAADGHVQKARDVLESVLRAHPGHVPAKTYQSVVMDLMGKDKAAEVLLGVAARADPSFGPARYGMARLLLRHGNPEAALEELVAACRAEPDNPTYQLRHAEVLLALGRDPQAAEVLTALVNAHPDHPDAWLCAARAFMRKGDARGALAALAQGLTHSPTHLGLALGAFQAAAATGDLAFCQRAGAAAAQVKPVLKPVLDTTLALVSAGTPQEAQVAADQVPAAHRAEVAQFLESILDSLPPKRWKILGPAVDQLKTQPLVKKEESRPAAAPAAPRGRKDAPRGRRKR
jgi:predicted Zn-dependent protease